MKNADTRQWSQFQKEKDTQCNGYRGVRFPPASSKNGWRAYTKSSKLVFSSPPSCNSSLYRLFVRRNCRNLATILGLSFPPRPPQQSFYVPSQNEPSPPPPPLPITSFICSGQSLLLLRPISRLCKRKRLVDYHEALCSVGQSVDCSFPETAPILPCQSNSPS